MSVIQKSILKIKMESNVLKEVNIKYCACYYFYYTIKIEDFDFGNILIDEKSYKNNLIYNISFKTLFTRFDEVDGFIRVCDEIRDLALFGTAKHDAIYSRIR